MAIRDLLWACPVCSSFAGIRPKRKGEECVACGTVYRRGHGANVEAWPPDEEAVVRRPIDWIERLPPLPLDTYRTAEGKRLIALEADLEFGRPPGEDAFIRRDLAVVRVAEGEDDIHKGDEFLGRMERLGLKRSGMLVLETALLRFLDDDGSTRTWALDELTAIQPSSSTLQIKTRGGPVVSIRFPEGSLRLWEELLQAILRHRYREQGRGEIVEFQPRISTR